MARRPPHPPDRPIQQIGPVRRTFPQFRHRVTRAGGVDWTGTLQPTVESAFYRVRLLHEPQRDPKVWVASPKLHAEAPHRWPDDGRLCLYWWREWRWGPQESLAATIIPWTAFWLYYYELWLVTREWLGPSSPHQTGTKKEAA